MSRLSHVHQYKGSMPDMSVCPRLQSLALATFANAMSRLSLRAGPRWRDHNVESRLSILGWDRHLTWNAEMNSPNVLVAREDTGIGHFYACKRTVCGQASQVHPCRPANCQPHNDWVPAEQEIDKKLPSTSQRSVLAPRKHLIAIAQPFLYNINININTVSKNDKSQGFRLEGPFGKGMTQLPVLVFAILWMQTSTTKFETFEFCQHTCRKWIGRPKFRQMLRQWKLSSAILVRLRSWLSRSLLICCWRTHTDLTIRAIKSADNTFLAEICWLSWFSARLQRWRATRWDATSFSPLSSLAKYWEATMISVIGDEAIFDQRFDEQSL